MEHPDSLCPSCGARLPLDAEVCPTCLLKLGLLGPDLERTSDGEPDLDRAASRTGNPVQLPSGSPEHIGPYGIVQALGEGGMGVVFLAEQTEPIRRRVALKVIKPGMDTREVLARFEAERQALAVMNHPNVARVFDAGMTEQGRPYFVMEYVPGIPITDYCDMRCLPLRDRLELFTKVCGAIQHAHQKGIIHRDIKPSNVLVATDLGSPILKVIDFGLAKAIGQPLTARTLFTCRGALIGTPEYMSPEQAGTTALDVDARTDIYSLGVLLYELLVGALPFEPATLRQAAAVEMLRIIQQEDPPRPTAKFDSLGHAAPEVARRRHTDMRSLARQLRGELEWITMRAMEKDPDHRYASVSELAGDVMRHLADEPILAGPPSRTYRLRKLLRKHRAAVVAAATVVCLLCVGVVVSTSLYVRAEAARKRAEAEGRRSALEARAVQSALLDDAGEYEKVSREAMELHRSTLGENRAALSLYSVNRLALLELVRAGAPGSASPGGANLRREAVDLVRDALDTGDPDGIKSASILVDLLPPDEAHVLARRALTRAREIQPGAEPEALANIERLVQRLQLKVGGSSAAADDEMFEPVYRESLARSRGVLPARSRSVVDTQRALGAVLARKAARLLREGDAAGAVPAFREALGLLGAGGAGGPAVAALRSDLGAALTTLGRLGEAEDVLLQAMALEKDRGRNNAAAQVARSRLARLYTAAKRDGDAARVRALLPGIFVEETWDVGALRSADVIASREGAYSALLGGRSVWVFAATRVWRPGPDGATTRQASVALAAPDHAAVGASLVELTDGAGLPLEMLPLAKDDRSFNRAHTGEPCVEPCGVEWVHSPGVVIGDQARNRLLVFYRRTLRDHSGTEQHAGTFLGAWILERPASAVPPVPARVDTAQMLFGPDEPAWGAAAVVVNGWLYAYACDAEGLTSACRIGRVPLDAALDRPAWRFFGAGGRWSSDWRDARPVLQGGIQSGRMSVHWNDFLGKYVAICSRVVDSRIAFRFADRPWGPWSEEGTIEADTLPSGPGWTWTTWGVGHAELTPDGGRTEYVTYRRNVGNVREIRLMQVRLATK